MERSICGVWKNQRGSSVRFDCSEGGELSGMYRTAVSGAGTSMLAPLVGLINYDDVLKCGMLAFVVSWTYADKDGKVVHSITAWNGILRGDVIDTTWILTRSCEPGDEWQHTFNRYDIFNREKV